jgi:dienelactone hydrolase
MRHVAILAVMLLAGGAGAADDFRVLTSTREGEPPARRLLHASLLAECDKHFAARKFEVDKLKTPADVAARQKALREKFVEALGGFPEKTPLNAKTVGTLKRDGYTVEKVIYESRPEHHVTANLYLPEGKGPFPGVLMPLGHSQNGKADAAQQRAAILLAKNGIAALVYDPIGQGERSQLLDKVGHPAIRGSTSEHTMCGVGALLVGRSTASYRVWDGIRSLDYLASRPEIDAKKLGCTGCSGGGTLTSYLMALDDRIRAAAPSCYITSLERLFATIGPQDAEQNITGQVAFGMDHADYIGLRAPKPTLVLASTRDFFDIQGTWATFREAKRIYTLLGFPERVDMIEADAGHGYPKAHREAMARFMCRWLKGEDRVITEGNFAIEKDADLQCTRSGQVLDDLRGKSVFDLNAALGTECAKKRAPGLMDRTTFRKVSGRLLGLPEGEPEFDRTNHFYPFAWNGATGQLVKYTLGKRLPVPGVSFAQKKPVGPLVVCAHGRQKEAVTAPESAVEKLVKGGRAVVVVDLRGWGETAPADPGKVPPFGVESKEAFLALHLNRPLLGQRVWDLLSVVSFHEQSDIELVGFDSAAPVVLHVAAFDRRVKAVTLDGGLVSWDNVLRTPISHNQLANVVPGVLAEYDLPDLAERLVPRPLTIRNPVDAAGKPLSKDAAEEAYRGVREAYKQAKAEDKFTLIVDAK